MANQQNSYTGSQGTGTNSADFSFTFPSFTTSEVKVEVDNVVKTLTTHYTVENYNTTSGGTVRFTTGNIPTGTTPVRIFRQTDVENPKAEFTAGSSLKAGEINDNFKQIRHALQEAIGAVATDRKVQRFNIESDTIDGTLIADDVINSEHYVAGSIDDEHLANDIIDGDNIQDDVINSEHYAAGSIDEEHLANSAVTQNKLANNSVGTPELINGSVNSDKILDGTIVNADVNASAAIAGTKISPNFGSQNIVTTGTISTGSFSTSGTIDGRDVAADGTKLDTIETNAKDDQTASEIKTLLQSDKLTANEIATVALDGRYYTETESDARYFNISTGDTIKDGDTFPDNDTTIATTAAINDRIIDLVDDVGGFVPIANETSFPTANPDVNNGAGTLVSIKAIGSTRTPSTGTVTIANGSGSNTVTITGCGSTVLTAGFGVIVETTTTLHTYAFHRLVPKATEVTAVAGKATEIGRLGTADAVADMAILGTADVVADLNTLGTADVVSDMNTLAVSDVISDMNTLAVTDVINDMDTVATNVTNVNNVGGSIANVNTTAGSIANVNTVAGSIANVNTTAGSISNVNTTAGSISNVNSVASNMANVNNFADRYQIASNNPSTDGGGNALAAGDLYFNTSANELKVYNGSSWQGGVTASGTFAATTGNTFTGDNRYNDNVKALFGTGSDLEIFHNASDTKITNSTGGLLIQNSGTGNIHLEPATNENGILVKPNGAVDLYYDNSKKLETTSSGVDVTGTVSSDDLQIAGTLFHEGDTDTKLEFGNNQMLLKTGSITRLDINNSNLMVRSGFALGFASTSGNSPNIKSGNTNNQHLLFTVDGTERFEVNNTGVDVTGNLAVTGTVDGIDIATDVAANTAKVTNATHTGEVTGGTALTIADNVVDEANLKVSNSPSNGYFLSAQSGNTGGLTWAQVTTDLVGDTSPQLGGDLDTNSHNINLDTDHHIHFGDNSEMSITHSGSSGSGTISTNTGDLIIKTTGSSADDIFIDSKDDVNIRVNETEDAIKCIGNGSVELYHDNTKMAYTSSSGFEVTNGDLRCHLDLKVLNDDRKLMMGSGADLKIYHNGTNSYINNATGALAITGDDLNFENAARNETYIECDNGAAVKLYYDNSKKFETTSTGVSVTGNVITTGNLDANADNARLSVGASADLYLTHTGSEATIDNNSGNLNIVTQNSMLFKIADAENSIICNKHGSVVLYDDDVQRLQTTADGALIWGPGNYTTLLLQRSSGTHSGKVQGWSSGDTREIGFAHPDTANWFLRCDKNASSGATGAIFFTTVRPSSNNTYDLGSTSNRWANVYTNDLHLSNEGHSNEIDGTWGNWTIQEGESDLFLKNNRSGKKYKFNLTEVS